MVVGLILEAFARTSPQLPWPVHRAALAYGTPPRPRLGPPHPPRTLFSSFFFLLLIPSDSYDYHRALAEVSLARAPLAPDRPPNRMHFDRQDRNSKDNV